MLGADAVLFIGYHARVGAANAILDHTWSTGRVAGLWLNDQPTGEIGLNAAVCGHFDAPVVMISGRPDRVRRGRRLLLGAIETAVVKHATGRTAAECLPAVTARC